MTSRDGCDDRDAEDGIPLEWHCYELSIVPSEFKNKGFTCNTASHPEPHPENFPSPPAGGRGWESAGFLGEGDEDVLLL